MKQRQGRVKVGEGDTRVYREGCLMHESPKEEGCGSWPGSGRCARSAVNGIQCSGD